LSPNCQASSSTSNFNGISVLHLLQSINLNGVPPAAGGKKVWGGTPSAWRFSGIYYQNNPFLGMFQLKFCLKTSKLVHYCTSLYLTAEF